MQIRIPKCNSCNSKNIVKKGIRKNKLQAIQKYQCKSCNKYFTLKETINKTYPAKIILKAISNYNLGYTLEKTKEIINKRYNLSLTPPTILGWLNESKNICTYTKLRNKAARLYQPKNIIFKKPLQHQQVYLFQYHKAKLHLLFHNILYNNQFHNISHFYEPIKQYLNKITTDKFPHHIFKEHKKKQISEAEIAQIKNNNTENKEKERRASQIKFPHLKIIHLSKTNLSNKLAKLALNLAKSNKDRHNAIQNFMLINDSTTIAAEIPVYLTKDDIAYFLSRKFTLPLENQQTPITGHIDLIQIRNGLIHIIDYKPDAKHQHPIHQLTIYALALASRTKLDIHSFKCAWFDENNYYEFFPLHAVYKKNK